MAWAIRHRSVSPPRSSNRTCGFPASGSATLGRHTFLGRGAVIALDRALDDPIEIRANNHLIARGDVVVVEDRMGVCITENVAADAARQNG